MAFIVEMWGLPKSEAVKQRKERNRFFQCHDKFWQEVLKLGREHGWNPMGTLPSDADCLEKAIELGKFIPTYEPGDYGRSTMILAQDAKAWAAALEKAVASGAAAKIETNYRAPLLLRDNMTEDDLIDANRGMAKSHIEEFIAFLKQGGFGFAWDD